MTEIIVPKVRTIVTLEALIGALLEPFERITGSPLEVVDGSILYGKLAMECGHPSPTQACWNNNIGNARGRSKKGKAFALPGAWEAVDPNAIPRGWHMIPTPVGAALPPGKVAVLADDPSHQLFRAFDDLAEGVEEYLELLGKSFPATLRELARIGSTPDAFVDAMVAGHYFTGAPTVYRATVASIAKSVAPKVAELLSRARAELPPHREHEALEILARLDDGPASPLRADEGEYTVPLSPDPSFE